MDLKAYYQKIREIEGKILEEFPVVASQVHPDGRLAGILTEVTRTVAAKLLVEGVARLASLEETKAFRAAVTEAKRIADAAMEAARLRVSIVPSAELEKLKSMAGKKQA
jgi:hypothetical protein